ncbi:hypothetical protein U1Q18_008952 [Sarracenia purpurea var. burkii]
MEMTGARVVTLVGEERIELGINNQLTWIARERWIGEGKDRSSTRTMDRVRTSLIVIEVGTKESKDLRPIIDCGGGC